MATLSDYHFGLTTASTRGGTLAEVIDSGGRLVYIKAQAPRRVVITFVSLLRLLVGVLQLGWSTQEDACAPFNTMGTPLSDYQSPLGSVGLPI